MSTAKDLLVINASEHTYCPDPNDPHNPPRDVRDIREAMHPADVVTLDDAKRLLGVTPADETRGVRVEVNPDDPTMIDITIPIVRSHSIVFDFSPREHPTPPGVGMKLPEPVSISAAHVATLPDGSRVNLPVGTVLREGEIERRSLPPINLNDALVRLAHGECDSAEKAALMHFIRCWHQPSREVIARDLLQRARVLLVETGGADVLAEIAAFLAGASPPEHPLFALVRSFVGKPGDRGPVWSALMRLRERLDESGDLAAIDLGDELVNALNERLGQMHDALGRDTTEERTL